jgi:hypothetical protein
MVTKNFLNALLLTVSFVGMGFAQETWNFPNFSAAQVFQGRKGEMTMKVFLTGQTVRVDRSATISTLYATESAKVYSLTTYPDDSHQCVSMQPEQAKMLPSPLELIQGKIVKAAGSEIVEGHPTKIEEVSVVGMDGKTIQSKVWEAEDLKGIPVKIESHVGEVTLRAIFRDIVIGTPQKALFEVPNKCTPYEKMWQVAEAKALK